MMPALRIKEGHADNGHSLPENHAMNGRDAVSLRMHSGIPVIDLHTTTGKDTEEAIARIVSALANAGHFEVILNACQITTVSDTLAAVLERVARDLQRHFGHLTLVGMQASDLLRLPSLPGIRMSRTEMEALSHIKRTQFLSQGSSCTAHIADDTGTTWAQRRW
jgi:hypothetical protein